MQNQYSAAQGISAQPLISFIVTDYNIPDEMLTECLHSILALNLREEEREIILVDDGSQANVLAQIGPLADELIYIRQRNQGLSVARNTGIQAAQGRYIQFVDGDDALIPEVYNKCLQLLSEEQMDMLLFRASRDKKVKDDFDADGPFTGREYMLTHNLHAAAWGYIFLKQMLRGIRFVPGQLHEDEEFTARLTIQADAIYEVKTAAYFYRERDNSITTTDSPEMKERRLDDVEQILYHLQELAYNLPPKDSEALERRIAQLTMDYLYNIMRLTHSPAILEQRIARLREKELFPLPAKNYTRKYTLFRLMTVNKLARAVMCKTLYNEYLRL